MPVPSPSFVRSRWAAIGAAVAVSLGAGGALGIAHATTTNPQPVLTTITPCRLLDTRPSPSTVGPRSTPLGTAETYTAAAWGTNGNCTLPSGITGLIMNVTITDPSAASFLTVFPSDQTMPLASNLNWVAGQAPTPNQVTVDLSADGKVGFFNQSGSVNVIADVVGYLADHDHDGQYAPVNLFAVVRANGNLVLGPHVTGVQHAGSAYKVTFDRDVSQCAYSALAEDPSGSPAFVIIAPPAVNPDPSSVGVVTGNPTGPSPYPFHLTVTC